MSCCIYFLWSQRTAQLIKGGFTAVPAVPASPGGRYSKTDTKMKALPPASKSGVARKQSQSWPTKHQPKTTADIIGNQGIVRSNYTLHIDPSLMFLVSFTYIVLCELAGRDCLRVAPSTPVSLLCQFLLHRSKIQSVKYFFVILSPSLRVHARVQVDYLE